MEKSVRPTLPSLLIQSFVSLALQGDESEVDPLPLQQVVVFAPLHRSAMLKANNHIGVLYGGQPVSDRDGGATQAYLQPNQMLSTYQNLHDSIVKQYFFINNIYGMVIYFLYTVYLMRETTIPSVH